MFSLSPIPPTSSGSRMVAGAPTGFCGTPDMVDPPTGPALRATGALIDDSRTALIDAMGALNPVSLMWVQPGQRPVQPDLMGGMLHAERGIAALDAALTTMPAVGGQLRSALESAAREARAGYQTLTLETAGRPDVSHASNSFNAAVNFLDIADNLLALQIGRFTPATVA